MHSSVYLFYEFEISIFMWFFSYHVNIYQVTENSLKPGNVMPVSYSKMLMHYNFTILILLLIYAVFSFPLLEINWLISIQKPLKISYFCMI